jgi:streptogramin lyase
VAADIGGNLWLTSPRSPFVCRVSTAGAVTAVYALPSSIPSGLVPGVITDGADGELWFGVQRNIASLDPSIPPS